jgi:hypothetical protein
MDNDTIDDIPDVSLIDNDIAPADNQPSETVEQGAPATDTEDKNSQPEQTTEGEKQPEATQEPSQNDEAERQRQNAEAAARRVQNRSRVKQDVAQQLDQGYGPKTQEEFQQELLDQGIKPEIAQLRAELQAEKSMREYNEQKAYIAELNAGMAQDAVNITNDFPVFNPQSKDYDADFAQMVEQQYRQAARLQADENNLVLNAELPLYDYYRDMATIYQRGTSRGAQQGQQEYQQMLSRTEDPGGSSATTKGDSLQELEDRLGDMVIS